MSQRKEAAAVVALAEAGRRDGLDQCFALVQVLRGEERSPEFGSATVVGGPVIRSGGLALLLGVAKSDANELAWSAVAVNEASSAYFVRAPSLRVPGAKRLEYFVPFLDHPDGAVADDAWREFAHASYDDVAAVAGQLPMQRLREWLERPDTPQDRLGFIGLALGLAPDAKDRRANLRLLEKVIESPANDFRAGFDGVLGGYLVARGAAALDSIEERILANPVAADGDVRHAMTALRFYHEYGREIPAKRLAEALRCLLRRPEFAAAAIVDLARWQDWESLEQVASLYSDNVPLATRRAVIGYLQACPLPPAQARLAAMRRQDPQGVTDAEHVLSTFGGQR